MTNSNFFSSLFNLSFDKFISLKIARFIYALILVIGTLGLFFGIINSFMQGFLSGIGSLFGLTALFLIYMISIRMALEGLIAGIRTAENTTEIVRMMREDRKDESA